VGAPVIVTKRGAEGCVVTWPGGSERVAAPSVAVIDTTGAGDAFSAGFLIGERREDAISSAVSAAASCLATMGAMPPRKEPGR
jgi:sugar/nucleoside kinase (ribokinase family)